MSRQSMSTARVIRYSLPTIVIAALGLPLSMYIPNYYIENLGVSAAAAATVFTILRLWDVVTDPILGYLSDRFDTPYGRRRIWIALSVPILFVAVFMLFLPMWGASASYLAFWLFILYIGWTMIQISHLAWAADLSTDYDDRSRIMAWREIGVVLGIFSVLLIAAILEISVPNEAVQATRAQSVRWMGIAILILLPLTVSIAVMTVGERKMPATRHVNFRAGLVAIGQNVALRRLVTADVLYRAGTAFTGTLFLWFMAWRLDMARFASLALAVYFLSALLSMPLWMRLSRYLEKHHTYVVAALAPAVTLLPFLILNGKDPLLGATAIKIDIAILSLVIQDTLNWDQLAGLLVMILYGASYGAQPYLARAIVADVADEDELRTGNRRTGLFFSLLTLTEKTGYALAVGVSLWLLGIIGLNTGPGAQNSPETVFLLSVAYVVPAASLFVVSGLLMWSFPLNRRTHNQLQEKLKTRAPDHAT